VTLLREAEIRAAISDMLAVVEGSIRDAHVIRILEMHVSGGPLV
jgi:hypothetical protein